MLYFATTASFFDMRLRYDKVYNEAEQYMNTPNTMPLFAASGVKPFADLSRGIKRLCLYVSIPATVEKKVRH